MGKYGGKVAILRGKKVAVKVSISGPKTGGFLSRAPGNPSKLGGKMADSGVNLVGKWLFWAKFGGKVAVLGKILAERWLFSAL